MKNLLKALNISLFILALATLTFTSCKKDSVDSITPQPQTPAAVGSMKALVNVSDEDELCFQIAYPMNVTMPDGSTQTANNEDELNAIYENWIASNPTDSVPPMLQFPLNVTLEDGSTLAVDTEDELIELLELCYEPEWETCFTIQYPLTVNMPDGTQQIANNDVELFAIFEDWYDQNPDATEDPTLVYPVSVQLADGTTVSVNNDEEFEALFDGCEGVIEPGDPIVECFTYVYPVTIQLPDGSQQSANSEEDILDIYNEWWQNASPDSIYPAVMPIVQFPYQVQLVADGSIVTVNNDEEFAAIIEACYGYSGGCGDSTVIFEDCFTFNFPLSLVFPDDSEVSVPSEEAMFDAVIGWYEEHPDDSTGILTFAFPISVTKDDGSVVTIHNEDELNALLEDCYGLLIDGEGILLGGKKANAATEAVRQEIGKQTGVKEKLGRTFAGRKEE